MSKITLNPFDIDLIAMVEQFTQKKAVSEMDLSSGTVIVTVSALGMSTNRIHALEQAVKGRTGEKFKDFSVSRSAIVIKFLRNEENIGSEMRYNFTNPEISEGEVFCRKLKEVQAVQFTRANQDRVVRFTGGGNVMIPRSIDGVAIYEFPTENGMLLTVKEGEMIINDNGRFYKQNRKEFLNDFEEK